MMTPRLTASRCNVPHIRTSGIDKPKPKRGQARKKNRQSADRKTGFSFAVPNLARLPWLMLTKAAALAGLIFLAWWIVEQLSSQTMFPVESVQINGEFLHLSKDELHANVVPLLEEGFFGIDLRQVRDAMLNLPWAEDAYVRRVWPSGLVITVSEKHPVAKWDEKGLISSRGDLFHPDNADEITGLISLSGPVGRHQQVLQEYNHIQASLLPLGVNVVWVEQDERRAWNLGLDNGVEVHLGKTLTKERLERFIRVYPHILSPEISRVRRVDLRYSNGFAVDWRTENDQVSGGTKGVKS